MHFHTSYITGNTVTNKWKYLKNNFRTELNKTNTNKLEILAISQQKQVSMEVIFFKGTTNARNIESNLQFHSEHLDGESSGPEKDSYASTDDEFVAECSSAENSIHIPTPSELSRLYAQRRKRCRCGKRLAEEDMIQIKRKTLDLIQSLGNTHEVYDPYHVLMSLR
jgi:hypothetical protein